MLVLFLSGLVPEIEWIDSKYKQIGCIQTVLFSHRHRSGEPETKQPLFPKKLSHKRISSCYLSKNE